MASTVSNGNDRSEKWQRPSTKGKFARPPLKGDSFFVRITNLWNALPSDLESESNVNVFQNKLKTFYFTRLRVVFDADDARTFKVVCCKRRRINNSVRCSCFFF